MTETKDALTATTTRLLPSLPVCFVLATTRKHTFTIFLPQIV
jgi:hypothetical protein